MFNRLETQAFRELTALSELAQRSPELAAQHAPQIHSLARMLSVSVEGRAAPTHIVVPERSTTVTLDTTTHEESAEVRIPWPTTGTVIGVGCDVAEGPEYRNRLSFRLDIQGVNSLVRKGGTQSGGGYAPISALGAQNPWGSSYLPVYWEVSPDQNWSMQFKSTSAGLDSGTVVLTPQPYFLFVERR